MPLPAAPGWVGLQGTHPTRLMFHAERLLADDLKEAGTQLPMHCNSRVDDLRGQTCVCMHDTRLSRQAGIHRHRKQKEHPAAAGAASQLPAFRLLPNPRGKSACRKSGSLPLAPIPALPGFRRCRSSVHECACVQRMSHTRLPCCRLTCPAAVLNYAVSQRVLWDECQIRDAWPMNAFEHIAVRRSGVSRTRRVNRVAPCAARQRGQVPAGAWPCGVSGTTPSNPVPSAENRSVQ